MNILVAVLLIGGLFFLNVFLLRKNKATPVPAGCENLKPDCGTCGIMDCSVRDKAIKKE